MLITKLVIHGGDPHDDDTLSACVGLAWALRQKSRPTIFRRTPTTVELEDPTCWVMDTGRRYDPIARNFDHHQLPGDDPPTCALTLVLTHIGLLDLAREASPWLPRLEMLDSKGPATTCRHLGVELDVLDALENPLGAQLLRVISRYSEIRPGMELYSIMADIGSGLLTYWAKYRNAVARLNRGEYRLLDITRPLTLRRDCRQKVIEQRKHKPSQLILVMDQWEPEDICVAAVKKLRKEIQELKHEIIATVTRDKTTPGWDLRRSDDNLSLDFRRCEGLYFTHSTGFLGVTPSMDLRQALKFFRPAMAQALEPEEFTMEVA